MTTVAEQLKQIGWEEGKRAGLEEGKQIGVQEGKMKTVNILPKLLRKRFGQISATLESKLRFSDIDTLDEFAECILDFQDMDDIEKWWDGR